MQNEIGLLRKFVSKTDVKILSNVLQHMLNMILANTVIKHNQKRVAVCFKIYLFPI